MLATIGQGRRKSEVVTHVAVEILSKTTLLTRYFLDLTSCVAFRSARAPLLLLARLPTSPTLEVKICQSIDRRDEMEVNKWRRD